MSGRLGSVASELGDAKLKEHIRLFCLLRRLIESPAQIRDRGAGSAMGD